MLRRIASLAVSLSYAVAMRMLRRRRQGCVVLYYHGVTRAQVVRFRRQMEWLQSHCSIVSLRSLLEGSFQKTCACITFDDALDNIRENALPILQELRIPATVFAVSGNLGRTPSWAIAEDHPDRQERLSTARQLKEYPPELIEIGSHTVTHSNLAGLAGESLSYEIAGSKKELEALLGYEVLSLSVPFGSYNEETLHAARQAGYQLVVTCDPAAFRPGDSPLRVGRFKVSPDDWDVEFRFKANGAHAWRRSWQRLKSASAKNSKRISSRRFAPKMECSL